MRLKLDFVPLEDFPYNDVNKHTIQGFIYSTLMRTEFGDMHDVPRFKFFTFSDIFPPTNFKKGEAKSLIISSPNEKFIEALYSRLKDRERIYLGKHEFYLKSVKKFSLKVKRRFITGSPIVLYKDNKKNEYFKFYVHHNINFFLQRLEENAVKKYHAYYGEEPLIEGNLFDKMIPRIRNGKVDIYVRIVKMGVPFTIVGSSWKLLEKHCITKEERKFYQFIMDCGLGEKNSLGFGFLNPLK
ncbi:CRISPR-associated endoribonuclease Cas6 [Thermococcus sp. LS2]|uniref:CRISPR-associated endoribonuclease Cas6 n=1 Tax=Thermococcus sp. LS2 TaxID=1638260 RepID=UPI00143A7489|nr:CRISPR-associated endoribonuclease Cas6 [Thermococcus sp. LS2]NJE13343.1 CRISPR-associated endoribonuclease Cas6 [Thermococcus sp. LS2]